MRKQVIAAIWLLATLALLGAKAAGQPSAPGMEPPATQPAQPKGEQVSATLLTDVSTAEPNQPLTAGVLLKMRPGWHVYWKYAGDAGLPTAVRWQLPEGWTHGELRWPVPVKFTQSGDIVGYGYDEQVLLTAKIIPPDQLEPNQEIPIGATVDWLACKDVCIPGQAELETVLTVAESPRPSPHASRLARQARRLPVDVTSENSPATAETAGKLRPGHGGRFTVTFRWKKRPPDEPAWLPNVPPSVKVDNAHVQTTGPRTVVRFDAALLPDADVPERMEALLAWDESGQRRAVRVNIPLVSEPARTAGSHAIGNEGERR